MTNTPHLTPSGTRRMPLLRQTEAAECGLASLAMVAAAYGLEYDLATLRAKFPISIKGMTATAILEVAAGLGLGGRGVRCEPADLKDLKLPAILHWDLNHFVVLKKARGGGVTLHDPALGLRKLTLAEVGKHFTGIAIELAPTPTFQPKRQRNPVKLESLVKFTPVITGGLVKALILSLVIEVLVLAGPFYSQLVIDSAILKGDRQLLFVLAVGFGLAAVFEVVSGAIRNLVFQMVGNALSFDMRAALFHHLMRLPLDWFQKRHVGDIQSRFQSAERIQQLITSGAIAVLLDGVLGIATAILMFVYAPNLALLVFGAVAAFTAFRFLTLDLQRRTAADQIINDAKEESRFLESVRAIQTLKIMGAEGRREEVWRNLASDTLNSGIRAGNLQIGFDGVNQIIMRGLDVVLVFVAASMVLDGEMTIGVMMAFMAYKGMFANRAIAFVNQVIALRLMDLQLERIADIALSPREEGIDAPARTAPGDARRLEGAVELRNVVHRYAVGEPDILSGASMRIAPGSFIAIAGPSGAGKSTLVKVMLGLLKPAYGEVLYDGRPIAHWGLRWVRGQLGVVMQDDALLAGSIAENVAGFDDALDMERVREACGLAQIHGEIERMPMGYHTLVGDLGGALSGGQKARVMIARALYRRPSILVMDEGTAHLDVASEVALNSALSTLSITRIVVAHRPQTLAAAEQVWVLEKGRLFEVPKAGAAVGEVAAG
jgi:ATP-binding cassette, subfamily B, bacterial CvaB/MchF/RaxB